MYPVYQCSSLIWKNLFNWDYTEKTRHVFVKHGCPRRQQSLNMAKISKSYILVPPHPQGQVISEKCDEPIGELTVQVWLLYHHHNFKYCTLFVSGTELQTNRRTNRQTDDPITRCPRRTFQAGGIINWEVQTLSLTCDARSSALLMILGIISRTKIASWSPREQKEITKYKNQDIKIAF